MANRLSTTNGCHGPGCCHAAQEKDSVPVKPVRAPLEAKIAPFGPPQPKLTSPLPAAPILTGCAAVPFTTTTCGEAGASSVTVIVEDRMPAATGAKIIGFEQFAFAANVPTHVAVPSEKSFMLTPPGTMFVTCIGAFPVLVSSRFCGEEVISHRNGARNVECARRREGRYRSGRWRGHARAHQRNDLRTSGAVGYRKRCLTCAHTQRAVGDGDRTVLSRDCHCSEDRLQHVGLTKGRSERARLRGIARDRIDEINLNAGGGRVAICRVDKVAVGIADFLENCQPVRERNRRGRKFLQRGGRIDIERSRTLLVGDLVLSVEQCASGSENNLGRPGLADRRSRGGGYFKCRGGKVQRGDGARSTRPQNRSLRTGGDDRIPSGAARKTARIHSGEGSAHCRACWQRLWPDPTSSERAWAPVCRAVR
jgi:hypothetical protein